MTDKEILDLVNAYNEIYKTVEEDNISEAPQFTKNYGDPKAAAWNKQMQSFNARSAGREMTPPAIPSGYRWNQQAGTIVSVTQGGAAPTARTMPTQTRPSGNLKGLSVGPGGFNINNKPVSTAPRMTDAQIDKKYGVNNPPGDEFAGARKNTRVVTQPAAKPTITSTPKPVVKPTTPVSPTARPTPTPTPTVTPSTPTTTSSSPSSQLTDLRKMRMASQMRQAGANVVSTQLASFDPFDIVMGHLLDEGYADTEEAALAIMANMSEEWKQSIVEAPGEWFGGLRDKARASKASQMQSSKPTPKSGPNVSSPFAKPASRTDSGKLTTYGAGGGAAAERAGQTRAQVMQQGAKNLERKNKSNPGPNFGR